MFRYTAFPRLRAAAKLSCGNVYSSGPSGWICASDLRIRSFSASPPCPRQSGRNATGGNEGAYAYRGKPIAAQDASPRPRQKQGYYGQATTSSRPDRRGFDPAANRRSGLPSSFSRPSDKPKRPKSIASNKNPPSAPQILELLEEQLPKWLKGDKTLDRVETYLHGSGEGVAEKLLKEFGRASLREFHALKDISNIGPITDHPLRSRSPGTGLAEMTVEADRNSMVGWDFQGLGTSLQYDEDWVKAIERALTRRFLSWAIQTGDPDTTTAGSTQPSHHPFISSRTASRLATLLNTTDLTSLPRTYTATREMHRHFHLHIGPTNSGKTYNALKSLALAGSGAYAGPLRLLAHEVWERMNRGTVGGLEEGKGRECNLITGEERRVVSLDASLTSCTVEMLSSGTPLNVVIIDEIQMIGDTQRGGSWTNAIMGVQADEVHLCGEETVIGVIQQMVASMGDKLTIHRYERLTPLVISDNSLGGDLSKVSKGDCVVAFSRSGIFAMKKAIEQKTGLRCAVVYGALPPETRAEQAKLFNDENSGVDVMVASDAVGMGLNLKIRRMIFEALHKWNGKAEVPLSLSQVKQIAGRAGRYGQHSTGAVGEVTTLNPEDLPLLRQVMPSPLPPVPRAVVEAPFDSLAELSLLLPSNTPFSTLLDEFSELAKVPAYCVYKDMSPSVALAESLNGFEDVLSLKEMAVFSQAPVNVRDDKVVMAFQAYLHAYAHEGEVSVADSLESSRLIPTLEMVELAREALRANPVPGQGLTKQANPVAIPPEVVAAIPMLESLHKALVLYLWLSFRFDLAFTERTEAEAIKLRVEESLEECLERLPGVRLGKRPGRRGAPAPELHVRQADAGERKINWMSPDAYKRMDLDRRFGGQDLLPPPARVRANARS